MPPQPLLYIHAALISCCFWGASLQAVVTEKVASRHYPAAQEAAPGSAREDAIAALKILVSRPKTTQTAKTLEAILAAHPDITDTEVPGLENWPPPTLVKGITGSEAGADGGGAAMVNEPKVAPPAAAVKSADPAAESAWDLLNVPQDMLKSPNFAPDKLALLSQEQLGILRRKFLAPQKGKGLGNAKAIVEAIDRYLSPPPKTSKHKRGKK